MVDELVLFKAAATKNMECSLMGTFFMPGVISNPFISAD